MAKQRQGNENFPEENVEEATAKREQDHEEAKELGNRDDASTEEAERVEREAAEKEERENSTPTQTKVFQHDGPKPKWMKIADETHKHVVFPASAAVSIVRIQGDEPTDEFGLSVGKHGLKIEGAGTPVWAYVNPKVPLIVIRGEGAISSNS